MRIEESYPTPIHGVSTLAPRNRARGLAEIQENMRSDTVAKLTRRPASYWRQFGIDTSTQDFKYYDFQYDGAEYEIFLIDETNIPTFIFRDGVPVTTTGSVASYVEGVSDIRKIIMREIEGQVIVVNPEEIIIREHGGESLRNHWRSHVNFLRAANYREVIRIEIDYQANYWVADEQRATKFIAEAITATITSGIPSTNCTTNIPAGGAPNLNVGTKGSTIGMAALEDIFVSVTSGQGQDTVAAINAKENSPDGLPKYAFKGTLITIQPDPLDEAGTYYLEAIASPDGQGAGLNEVIWTETYKEGEDTGLRFMPYVIDLTDGVTADIDPIIFETRKVGDDISVPPPAFVQSTITGVDSFQKRLVLISGNTVSMSRTEEPFNFWKQSAVGLLATDTLSIRPSGTGIGAINNNVTHNRDLLFFTDKAQYKIPGNAAVTPNTVAMPQITSYEADPRCSPLSLGNSVYFPINYGTSSGLSRYSGEKDTTQDAAEPITHHVIGYMEGHAVEIKGSANLDMLTLRSSDSDDNAFFVYEEFRSPKGEATQQSWSRWSLPTEYHIEHLSFDEHRLKVIAWNDGTNGDRNAGIERFDFEMYSNVASTDDDIFLDIAQTMTSVDGITFTGDSEYDWGRDDLRLVGKENTDFNNLKIEEPYTNNGDGTITFDNAVGTGSCSVVAGTTYRSGYKPTRPFKYDDHGIAVTSDRISISRFRLNLVDTGQVNATITSKYYDDETQSFDGIILNEYTLGDAPFFTGDYDFSFQHDAEQANIEFWTEEHRGLTIAGISWIGRYYQASKRLT